MSRKAPLACFHPRASHNCRDSFHRRLVGCLRARQNRLLRRFAQASAAVGGRGFGTGRPGRGRFVVSRARWASLAPRTGARSRGGERSLACAARPRRPLRLASLQQARARPRGGRRRRRDSAVADPFVKPAAPPDVAGHEPLAPACTTPPSLPRPPAPHPYFGLPLKAIQGILIRNGASAKARFRRRI